MFAAGEVFGITYPTDGALAKTSDRQKPDGETEGGRF
jgi:hypothetical protein